MIAVDIKPQVAEVKAGLEAIGVESKWIGKKILRALATITKKQIKRRMGVYVRERTGMLKANIYGMARSPTHAVVAAAYARVAEPLERGATILPKKGNHLTFRGDGGWVRAKSVTIPATRFFTRSAEGFEAGPEYQSTIDKIVGKVIQKAMK